MSVTVSIGLKARRRPVRLEKRRLREHEKSYIRRALAD
jgi:hypothetical protein